MNDASASKIRVVVVDDHPMVREIVKIACEDHPTIELVGFAATGREALKEFRRCKPDVMVLDLGLPDMNGLEVIRRITAEGGNPKVLVLTATVDRAAMFDALRLGVAGYLEKTAPVQQIAAAIEAVVQGTKLYTVQHRRTAHSHLGEFGRTAADTARSLESLTPREREVLALIAEGLSTRQVSTRLSISVRTAETHISNLYDKLDVRTRVEAVHRAAGLGLVDLG